MEKFDKPALSIAEQLDLLISRGLEINDRCVVDHWLKHVTYHRLAIYLRFFQIDEFDPCHKYVKGTKFEDVVSLYNFDRNLRLMLLDALERIEVSFRGQFSYTLAHHENPWSYLNRSSYRNSANFLSTYERIISSLAEVSERPVKHFYERYSEPTFPPVWIAAEILSFGTISKLVDNLQYPVAEKIADAYGLRREWLVSWMAHLSHVRNCCAHHARVWNRDYKIPKLPGRIGLTFNQNFPGRLFNTIQLLSYLMTKISPESNWRFRIDGLIKDQSSRVITEMGYPKKYDF